VTEPSSRAAYWRLAGLGEPSVALTSRPEGPSTQDAATEPEAQEPQPEAAPPGAQPEHVADEAGPHQREVPGGEPQ
jgi:hypothetical protein